MSLSKPSKTGPSGGKNVNYKGYIKLMQWNLGGVFSKAHGNKLMDDDFIETINSQDFIAITETHVGKDKTIKIPGYKIFKKCRKKSKRAKKFSGGVALAVKNELAGLVTILPSKSDNILWTKLKCVGKDLLIGVVYISPVNSSYTVNVLQHEYETWDILIDEITKFRHKYQLCLTGDFNARTGAKPDFIVNDGVAFHDFPDNHGDDSASCLRNNEDKVTNKFGDKLISVCTMSECRIVNGRKMGDSSGKRTCHEYNGSSLVDYIICDVSLLSKILTFKVHDRFDHLSDHCPISTIINLNMCYDISSINKNSDALSAPKRLKWDGDTETQYKTKLSSPSNLSRLNGINRIDMSKSDGVEESVTILTNVLTASANIKKLRRSPSRKLKRKLYKNANKPWFHNDLSLLKKDLKNAGRAFVCNCNNKDLRDKYFAYKKRYKSAVCAAKRKFKQSLYDKLADMSSSRPKEYWELFDQLKKFDNGDKGSDDDDNPISEQEWIKHYVSLLGPKTYNQNRLDEIRDEISKLEAEDIAGQLDGPIEIDEINEACKTLKNNKAVGIDQISNEMVKASLKWTIKPLKKIFNAIIDHQYYPKEWKVGIVVNLFKSGDEFNTDNYRGLTINSSLAKIFNTIMNNRLIKFFDKHNIITDNQIGFKKKARTSDHIFIVNTIFRKLTKSKEDLYLCFVDFKKAYDSVWQEALMLKLLRSGIRGKFQQVIKNMYNECTSCIKYEGKLSENFPCETGVKQGDVLSPNLFNLYINDLPKIYDDDKDSPKLHGDEYLHCLLYADDLILFSLNEQGLQSKINKLHEYCRRWSLTINAKKTKVMKMSKSNKELPKTAIFIGDARLEWTESYKYLGLELNCSGDFMPTSENLCTRGWKAVFKIKSALKSLDINPELSINMFDTLVKPIVCYGSEIWGAINTLYCSKSKQNLWEKVEKLPVEVFQLKYCKGLLGVHKKSQNAAVMGELGRYPLFIQIMKTMLRYVKHLDEVKEERPLLAAAIKSDEMLANGKSWRKNLEKIVKLFGFSTRGILSDSYIDRVITAMKQNYESYWKDSLGDKNSDEGRLYIYRHIKNCFMFEPYLKIVPKLGIRRALTKFRISSNNLEIETGRYANNLYGEKFINRNERFCTLCKEKGLDLVGDEIHAALHCKTFEDQRNKVLKNITKKVPNFNVLSDRDKLIYMLTCESDEISQIGKFFLSVFSYNRPNLRGLRPKKKKDNPSKRRKNDQLATGGPVIF